MDLYYATAKEMAELDELAVEHGLEIKQMMELAGWHVLELFRALGHDQEKKVCVVVGKGNKAGDGLCAARHLTNKGYDVSVVIMGLDISGDALHHLGLMKHMGTEIVTMNEGTWRGEKLIRDADVIIDALIGYKIDGPPRPPFDRTIDLINASSATVISYDVPSGSDPTTGKCYTPCIEADATLTLALPKRILGNKEKEEKYTGRIFLADIGIPAFLYDRIAEGSRPDFKETGMIEIS